jgi:hypothetical protein
MAMMSTHSISLRDAELRAFISAWFRGRRSGLTWRPRLREGEAPSARPAVEVTAAADTLGADIEKSAAAGAAAGARRGRELVLVDL